MRLVRIKDVTAYPVGDEIPPKVLEVIFEGDPIEAAHVEVTLQMKDRGNDEAQLRDARAFLRDAIRAAHEELQRTVSSET
jgi:hypothetical protein